MRKLVRSDRFSLSRPDGRGSRLRDALPQSPSPVEPLLGPIQPSPCLQPETFDPEGCNISEIILPSEHSFPISYTPPILRLPPEIRHSILEYLVPRRTKGFKVYTDCEPTISASRWNRTPTRPRRRAAPPTKDSKENSLAILRTNRIFYYEALSTLYSENIFHFIGSNYLPILDFFRRLSPEARNFVRQIRITMLPDGRELRQAHFDLFHRVMQDFMPGLNFLDSEPSIAAAAAAASTASATPEVIHVLASRI